MDGNRLRALLESRSHHHPAGHARHVAPAARCAVVRPARLPRLDRRRAGAGRPVARAAGPHAASCGTSTARPRPPSGRPSGAWSAPIVAARGVSIGRPMANTGVWILDANLQPCPIGVPGEICISGMGVTLGYLERPELTAERFVDDRRSTACTTLIYRSGDRGRWRNDGLLEHMGRFDFQVKVRGYRIELGEIEAALQRGRGRGAQRGDHARGPAGRRAPGGLPRAFAGRRRGPGRSSTATCAAACRSTWCRSTWWRWTPSRCCPTARWTARRCPSPAPTRQDAGERLAPRNERERARAADHGARAQPAGPGHPRRLLLAGRPLAAGGAADDAAEPRVRAHGAAAHCCSRRRPPSGWPRPSRA